MKPMPAYPSRCSQLLRCTFAGAAVVATLTLGAFIELLASHYSGQAIATAAKPVVVAAVR